MLVLWKPLTDMVATRNIRIDE